MSAGKNSSASADQQVTTEKVDGAKIAAEILTRLPKENKERIFKAIEAKLINLDPIGELPSERLKRLVKEVDHRDLLISLQQSSEPVKLKLFRNMESEQQRSFLEDLVMLDGVKSTEILAAKQRVLAKLNELQGTQMPRKRGIYV